MLTVLLCTSLFGAERAPQAPQLPTFMQMIRQGENEAMRQTILNLPADIQLHLLRKYFFTAYPNIPEMADRITAFQDKVTTNMMLDFLKALPYTANALDLAQQLKNLPIMQNKEIQDWLAQANTQLKWGQELYNAAEANDEETVANLLKVNNFIKKNTDLNWHENYSQWTALHAAIIMGYTNIVKLLLAAGANPNIKDWPEGWTPLIHAAFNNKTDPIELAEIIRLLLAAGADPDAKDRDGYNAFWRSLGKRNYSSMITNLIKRASAERKAKSEKK